MKGPFNYLLRRIQLKKYRTIEKIVSHLTFEEKIALLSLARSSEGTFVEIWSISDHLPASLQKEFSNQEKNPICFASIPSRMTQCMKETEILTRNSLVILVHRFQNKSLCLAGNSLINRQIKNQGFYQHTLKSQHYGIQKYYFSPPRMELRRHRKLDKKVDFVFIDGGPSYEGVKKMLISDSKIKSRRACSSA